MRWLSVGAASLNQIPLDWEGNGRRIREAIDEARSRGVGLLCLPEMCLTGYGCEDMFHASWLLDRAEQMLLELAEHTVGMVVSFGIPMRFRNAVFNTACLVVDGRIVGFVGKQFLASDGIHYEPRWFRAWQAEAVGEVKVAGATYPIGDLHFDVGGVRVAFEICEDAWVASRPGARHSLDGVDVVLNPSASHFAFDKISTRERFVIEGSRAFGVTYVYANLLGNEAGRAIYDGGALVASGGRLLARGPRLGLAEVSVTHTVVDIDLTRAHTARTGSFRPDFADDARSLVEVPWGWPAVEPRPLVNSLHGADWEDTEWCKEEEFLRAEALGLFDYLRKSYSRGFVISLSGGADSAACAVLVAEMVRIAVAELGVAGFKRRLGYITSLAECETVEQLVGRLLTTVYQSTRNSGPVTLNAARGVAEGIGARFLLFDVDALVQGYRGVVSQGIGRELTWERDDITLQNIQARARAPSVWMVANIEAALLLSTSNRSEAAVGYATMDGDTAGGISPIAGIDKAFLRTWLRWMEEVGPHGGAPIPSLGAVNKQQPTAELRPPGAGQTDEGDLMPYPVLDAIEDEAIGNRRSPVEVFRILRARRPEVTPEQLGTWVQRFFRLWTRNQWKRERYAPSFHLDDRNLDPRSWCRFPILSGGFVEELRALEEEVEACR